MRKLFNILTNAWKIFAAAAGFGAIVWGGFEIYHTIVDTQDMVVDVWTQQGVIETKMDSQLEQISDSLKRLEKKVDKNSADIYTTNALIRYEREHRGEVPIEQMNSILDQMEELLKKNEIVYTGSSYESITKIEIMR